MKSILIFISCLFIVMSCLQEESTIPTEKEVKYIDGKIRIGGFEMVRESEFKTIGPCPESRIWIDTIVVNWNYILQNYFFEDSSESEPHSLDCGDYKIRISSNDTIYFNKEEIFGYFYTENCKGLSVDIILDRNNSVLKEVTIKTKRKNFFDGFAEQTLNIKLINIPYTVNSSGQIVSEVTGDITNIISLIYYSSKENKVYGNWQQYEDVLVTTTKTVYGLDENAYFELTLNPE